MKKTIIKKQGKKPGKTLAIFCGVHGNERAGIKTVDYLQDNLEVERGTVYLVYANPKAIEQGVRETEKNLNRCFLESAKEGVTYEEKRACELMDLLDTCDALLDLHAYNETNGEPVPFVLTETNALDLVSKLDISTIVTGIDEVEKGGSDGYMSNQGKIGICCELGSINNPEKYLSLGIKTAHHFLQYFGAIDEKYKFANRKQKTLKASGIYYQKNEGFCFTKKFKTFDRVEAGTHICTDGKEKVIASEDMYILFPGGHSQVGTEAYVEAKEIN